MLLSSSFHAVEFLFWLWLMWFAVHCDVLRMKLSACGWQVLVPAVQRRCLPETLFNIVSLTAARLKTLSRSGLNNRPVNSFGLLLDVCDTLTKYRCSSPPLP